MKKLIIASFLSAASVTAFAQQPRYPIDAIPPPLQEMSGDAAKVSNILMNPQIKSCVEQFNKTGASVSSVTAQFIPSPGQYNNQYTSGYTEYKFSGNFAGKYEEAVATLIVDEEEKSVKTSKGQTRKVLSYSCQVVIAN